MTRGMKGCYIYCTDKALSNYIRMRLPAEAAPYSMAYASYNLKAAEEQAAYGDSVKKDGKS